MKSSGDIIRDIHNVSRVIERAQHLKRDSVLDYVLAEEQDDIEASLIDQIMYASSIAYLNKKARRLQRFLRFANYLDRLYKLFNKRA